MSNFLSLFMTNRQSITGVETTGNSLTDLLNLIKPVGKTRHATYSWLSCCMSLR